MGFDAKYADLEGAVVNGGVCLGSVTLDDFLRQASPSAASQKASADTHAALDKEKEGTAELIAQLAIVGVPAPRSLLHPQGQVRVCTERRWRFDLAWPEILLAVELQGMQSHGSAKGLKIDSEKYCTAAYLGWTVMPVIYAQIRSGKALTWIEGVYHRLQKGVPLLGFSENAAACTNTPTK